jgi:putative transposase
VREEGELGGEVGIFLKAMWDTTFTDSVGDVVLDVQDVLDVGKRPG